MEVVTRTPEFGRGNTPCKYCLPVGVRRCRGGRVSEKKGDGERKKLTQREELFIG